MQSDRSRGTRAQSARLLREFKLASSAFGDPENRISYSTVGRIFGRCVEAASCEHFGLLVGERAGISSLGAVGYLAQSAPNVRTALHTFQRPYHSADGGGTITLDHHDGSVSFGYAFGRWAGMGPAEWRSRRGRPAPSQASRSLTR